MLWPSSILGRVLVEFGFILRRCEQISRTLVSALVSGVALYGSLLFEIGYRVISVKHDSGLINVNLGFRRRYAWHGGNEQGCEASYR